jgi:hypothetical protein
VVIFQSKFDLADQLKLPILRAVPVAQLDRAPSSKGMVGGSSPPRIREGRSPNWVERPLSFCLATRWRRPAHEAPPATTVSFGFLRAKRSALAFCFSAISRSMMPSSCNVLIRF